MIVSFVVWLIPKLSVFFYCVSTVRSEETVFQRWRLRRKGERQGMAVGKCSGVRCVRWSVMRHFIFGKKELRHVRSGCFGAACSDPRVSLLFSLAVCLIHT